MTTSYNRDVHIWYRNEAEHTELCHSTMTEQSLLYSKQMRNSSLWLFLIYLYHCKDRRSQGLNPFRSSLRETPRTKITHFNNKRQLHTLQRLRAGGTWEPVSIVSCLLGTHSTKGHLPGLLSPLWHTWQALKLKHSWLNRLQFTLLLVHYNDSTHENTFMKYLWNCGHFVLKVFLHDKGEEEEKDYPQNL